VHEHEAAAGHWALVGHEEASETDAEKTESFRSTFVFEHLTHWTFSSEFFTSFSNSAPQLLHLYS
jgi:hypothetical protein